MLVEEIAPAMEEQPWTLKDLGRNNMEIDMCKFTVPCCHVPFLLVKGKVVTSYSGRAKPDSESCFNRWQQIKSFQLGPR